MLGGLQFSAIRAGSEITISRELRRNAATRRGRLDYRASVAQWHADRQARRPELSKLAASDRLQQYVQDRLASQVAAPDGRRVSASAPSTCGDGRRSRPCSSRARYSTLIPVSVASSERRSPGVRRRKPAGSPTSAGLMASRRLRRNAPSSLSLTPATYRPPARSSSPCQGQSQPGLPTRRRPGQIEGTTSKTLTTTTTALPLPAGHWTLDPFHSAVGFTIRHLGIAKVRGQSGRFPGPPT